MEKVQNEKRGAPWLKTQGSTLSLQRGGRRGQSLSEYGMIFATVVAAIVTMQFIIGGSFHGLMISQIDAFGPQKSGLEEKESAKFLVMEGSGTETFVLAKGSVMTHDSDYQYTSVSCDVPPGGLAEDSSRSAGTSTEIELLITGEYRREGIYKSTQIGGGAGSAYLGSASSPVGPQVPGQTPPPPPAPVPLPPPPPPPPPTQPKE